MTQTAHHEFKSGITEFKLNVAIDTEVRTVVPASAMTDVAITKKRPKQLAEYFSLRTTPAQTLSFDMTRIIFYC